MRSATLAVLILASALPASAADGVIRVTARYPGADARTVDETVLSVLFRQITGVEDLLRIESEARNDGTGTLTVYLQPKTDLNFAMIQVQNSVNLALPRIPEPCRQLGISVRKLPTGPPVFWLALTSTDPTHDETFLKNYANIHLTPEFARVPGVADVRIVGHGEFGIRVRTNPDRLRAYKLTARDVVDALRRQNAQVAAGGSLSGKIRQYTVTSSGLLKDIRQFENVILRANAEGEVLRLKDVAKVDFGTTQGGFTRVDGKPAALIAVSAWPNRVSADKFRNSDGVGDLPAGMRFDVVDRAADHLLSVEVQLPPGSASLEWTEKKVAQATDLIRALPGKPGTVAVVEGRELNAATILIKIPAKGGPTAADVEKALTKIPNTKIRVGDMPPGKEAFPVRIALTDPGELLDPGKRREERFREVTDRVIAGLVKDRVLAAPATFPGPAAPQLAADIDRDKCAMRGVELNDLFTTLQTALGGVYATDFHKFGQALRVTVQVEPQFARFPEDLTQLAVRSAAGEMVPLVTLLKIREAHGPTAVVRVNGALATIITAAPAVGMTPAEAAAKCVKLAQKVLPRGYHVKDLTGP